MLHSQSTQEAVMQQKPMPAVRPYYQHWGCQMNTLMNEWIN